jgi:hypothetical protein
MRDRFANQRPVFDQLLALATADSGVRGVSRDHFVTRWGRVDQPDPAIFPEERWREYRRLMDVLELEDGVWNGMAESRQLRLSACNHGGVLAGKAKGYIHSETPLAPIFDSLDDGSFTAYKNGGFAYLPLADGWYLYSEGW